MSESAGAEAAIEPERRICDSHHHLWRRPGNDYQAADFLRDAGGGHRIVSSVFIECGAEYGNGEHLAPVGEVRFADAAAGAAPDAMRLCAAIVGFADLLRGERVAEVLDAELAASARFRGVRHCAAVSDDPAILSAAHSPVQAGMLADAVFRAGFAQLAPRGLSFDMWVYHPQLDEVAALAAAFPNTRIVLDHLGGPLGIASFRDRRDEVFRTWRAAIARLAHCPNVAVKLGGICMPLNGWRLHGRAAPISSAELAGLIGPYILHAIDCFGPERAMFESNFPADRPSVGYTVLWNAFKRVTAGFSGAERDLLFHDSAAGVYRIA